ncbi:MAG: sulfotransferase [Gammaproteobacteria bacterium]|nr:sulfotransferase [Gammaproteobacteria bacterium]
MNLFAAGASVGSLPTFICVGAEKSGSTALYDNLRTHPDVYMSPIKEPNFFATDVRVANFRDDYVRHEKHKGLDLDAYFRMDPLPDRWGAYLENPEHYLRLFAAGKAAKARGEVSNSYLYSSAAAQNIADSLPDVRILVVLREPVARAFSHYRAMVRDGRALRDCLIDEVTYDSAFPDRRWGSCHGYVDHGLYARQIERLYAAIDPGRIKVILADDFFANTAQVMQEVFTFLGLRPLAHKPELANRNRSTTPRNAALIRLLSRTGIKSRGGAILPIALREQVKRFFFTAAKSTMTPAEQAFLAQFFAEDVERLEDLLQRSLAAWRRNY